MARTAGIVDALGTIIHWALALIIERPVPADRAYCLSSNYTLIDSDCARIVNTSELGKPIRLISPGALAKMSFAFMNVRDVRREVLLVK